MLLSQPKLALGRTIDTGLTGVIESLPPFLDVVERIPTKFHPALSKLHGALKECSLPVCYLLPTGIFAVNAMWSTSESLFDATKATLNGRWEGGRASET